MFTPTFESDQEHAEAVAMLTEIVGAEEAAKPSMCNRMVRRNGAWAIRVLQPAIVDLRSYSYEQIAGRGAGHHDAPWSAPPNLNVYGTKTLELPVSEGIALLTSETNPEIEVNRRLEVTRAYEARLAAEKEAAAAREEERRKAAKARAELGEALEIGKWGELSHVGQALFLVALAIEDGKTGPDLVAELRRIGDETRTLNGTDAGTHTRRFSGHGFPWRPWR